MVRRRWRLGLGGLGLGFGQAMAKPRKRYARSMVANADDLLRWFPNASLVVLRGAAVQIGIEELGMAEALLNGSELFPQDALHFGFGIYNPSLAHAKPGYLLAVFRASNWHYCPESGWDGNWTSVPHHKAQVTQYNQPILATLKLPDLTVVEAVPVAFQRDRFRARFQEVQDGKVLAERSIEGPEDLRLYKFEEDYWLSFSFRTSYIAKLQTRLCFGERAHGCTPAAWIETGTLTEITPEALHRREHREQQAFKNLNLAQVRKESILVEFSLNPRIMLEVDLASGLWQQAEQSWLHSSFHECVINANTRFAFASDFAASAVSAQLTGVAWRLASGLRTSSPELRVEGFATFRTSEVLKPVRDELNFESEQVNHANLLQLRDANLCKYASICQHRSSAQAYKDTGDCRHVDAHRAGRMSKPPKSPAMARIPVGMRMGDLPFFNAGFGVQELKDAAVAAVEPGFITFKMKVGPEHVNALQTLHGAFSMLLLDCLTTVVINQMDQRPSVSVNMTGQYQGAAKLGDELTIDCRLEKAGKNLAFASMTIKSADHVVFTGQHTKMLLQAKL
ncbi:ACOT13 [Symbiodinium sp. CCMP2456]|nr:ACOT13 [Symbiodinium sp. CCMP2456]